MKKTIGLLLGLCLLLQLFSASAQTENTVYGVWLPYWEIDDSMQELSALSDRVDTVVAFECLFDANDQLLMLYDAETLLSLLQAQYSVSPKVYLSIVNDIELAPDSYDNKNTDLLRRLFATEDARAAHLAALETLIDTYHLAGLELDYENLKDDTALWANYALFIQQAWTMCQNRGIGFRVVLPYNAPKYAALPNGPTYSVMCYNLYGSFSGPGPKADLAFLQQTCDYYQPLLPNVRMAFATGGNDWHGDSVTALTQQQAEDALALSGAAALRDAGSGAVTATYTTDGETHTVWYADATTLASWRDLCAQNGITGFDLFRLGGNNVTDLANVFFIAKP